MSYQLIIGRLEKDWHDNQIKYQGHTESTRLEIPSIEIAHEIARLVGITSYMIADTQDTFGHNANFVTPDITAWENKVQAVNKGKADIEHVGLTELQRKVDKALGLRLTNETIPYNPKPRYWMDVIRESERNGGSAHGII